MRLNLLMWEMGSVRVALNVGYPKVTHSIFIKNSRTDDRRSVSDNTTKCVIETLTLRPENSSISGASPNPGG